MEDVELIKLAFQACDNAYAPYSNFHVGAVVLLKNGQYFMGANIENAAYGSTNCAERSAIFATYSYGYRKDDIEKLAIVSHAKTISYCCGACRQVLSELLNPDTPIVFANDSQYIVKTISEIMPYSFGSEDLAQ